MTLSVIALLVCAAGQTQLTLAQQAAVDAAVHTEMIRQEAVGVAIGVIRDGKVAYTRGYGLADRAAGTPVDRKTLFRWASVSKPLTAVAAMQLAMQHKLDMDADVRTLIPEFPEHAAPITTRQLLGHLGGIVHYRNGPVIKTPTPGDDPNPHQDVIKALDRFKASPLVSEPGESFNYSTHGYILASGAIQRAGGAPYARLVHQGIAVPLGMKTLRPDYQWQDIPNRATGYRLVLGSITPSTDTDVSWKLGGGGWISSIDDLARFGAGMLGDELLPATERRAMWTPLRTTEGQPTGYGLGFNVKGTGDDLEVSHNGRQEKTRTRLELRPASQDGIVVMSNCEWIDPAGFTRIVRAALESPE